MAARSTRRLGNRHWSDGFNNSDEAMEASVKAANLPGMTFAEFIITPLVKALLGKWKMDFGKAPPAPCFSDTNLVRMIRLATSGRIAVVDDIQNALTTGDEKKPKPGDAVFYGKILDWLKTERIVNEFGELVRSDITIDNTVTPRLTVENLKDFIESYAIARDVYRREKANDTPIALFSLHPAMDEFIDDVKKLQDVDNNAVLVFAPFVAEESAMEVDSQDESEELFVSHDLNGEDDDLDSVTDVESTDDLAPDQGITWATDSDTELDSESESESESDSDVEMANLEREADEAHQRLYDAVARVQDIDSKLRKMRETKKKRSLKQRSSKQRSPKQAARRDEINRRRGQQKARKPA